MTIIQMLVSFVFIIIINMEMGGGGERGKRLVAKEDTTLTITRYVYKTEIRGEGGSNE